MKIEIPKRLIPSNCILSGFRGSIAHNLHSQNSIDDIDLMAIYVAPITHYIGIHVDMAHKRGIQTIYNEFDMVIYEIRHFTNLCLRFNPNIIPLLWLNEDHYLTKKLPGKLLIENRDCFSSKRAYTTLTGYANSQLENVHKSEFRGYMGVKRKALVEKFGYDCKNACHSIRLLKMGIEFLETGRLNVYRTKDKDQLSDIKGGKWALSEVKDYAACLYEDAKKAYEKSHLPEKPDSDTINEIFMEIISDYIYEEYQMPMALKRY
jgi:predicted nucleotidyltransferase